MMVGGREGHAGGGVLGRGGSCLGRGLGGGKGSAKGGSLGKERQFRGRVHVGPGLGKGRAVERGGSWAKKRAMQGLGWGVMQLLRARGREGHAGNWWLVEGRCVCRDWGLYLWRKFLSPISGHKSSQNV